MCIEISVAHFAFICRFVASLRLTFSAGAISELDHSGASALQQNPAVWYFLISMAHFSRKY